MEQTKPERAWKVWTEAEIAILTTHYPNGGWSACREAGLQRGPETTHSKAHALGIHQDPNAEWSAEEVATLEARHDELTGHEAARTLLPRRTMSAIGRKARELGLKLPGRVKWGRREDAILRRHYGKDGPGEVERRLPERSRSAIKARAQKLGLRVASHRPWSVSEEQKLRASYARMGSRGCAEALKRTVRAVASRARQLGLRADRKGLQFRPRKRRVDEYSRAEDEIVVKFYPREGAIATAARLPGRNSERVYTRVKQLRKKGLLIRSQWDWTDGEIATLREHYPVAGAAATAELLPKRTVRAVETTAGRLGIRVNKAAKAQRQASRVKAEEQLDERVEGTAPTSKEVRDGDGRLIGYSTWDGRAELTTPAIASDPAAEG